MNASIDIEQKVIETDRLILRAFKDTDLNDLFEYAKVEGVGEAAGWPHHKDIATSKVILDSFIQHKKVFAIVYKENQKVIGSLGIEKYKEKELPEFKDLKGREIGYVLSKEYWGKGLMPEAVSAVIQYLFEELSLDFLVCGYYKTNTQSKRVNEKCGFQFYKEIQYEATQLKQSILANLNLLRKEEWYNGKL